MNSACVVSVLTYSFCIWGVSKSVPLSLFSRMFLLHIRCEGELCVVPLLVSSYLLPCICAVLAPLAFDRCEALGEYVFVVCTAACIIIFVAMLLCGSDVSRLCPLQSISSICICGLYRRLHHHICCHAIAGQPRLTSRVWEHRPPRYTR